MSAPPWVASPFLLPPVLPCLLFLPPPAPRAVPWTGQPDRHGKPVLLRQQGEWRRLRRLHLPHRLWAQLHDLRRAQRLIGFLLLHYPVIGPEHGWRDIRRDAHRGTLRTRRLLRTRRRVSQSSSVVFDGSGKTWWRKKCRSVTWFWCHEKHVQYSQQVSCNHPSWENGR